MLAPVSLPCAPVVRARTYRRRASARTATMGALREPADASQAPAGAAPLSLSGQVAIVTGSNSGIGFETARELARLGATVVLACRRTDAAEAAASEIRAESPAASVVVLPLDLASLDSVRDFVRAFHARFSVCHLLVNNAGCNFWNNSKPAYTAEGVGLCAQVNFLGCYALTRLLLGTLLASAPSRVVTVSSVMHRTGSLRLGAARFLREWERGGYGDAKLAQVLFSYELDRRCAARGLRAVVADPGAVQTEIWRNTPLARPAVKSVMDRLYAPPREGAASVIHASLASLAPPPAPVLAEATRSTHVEAGRLFFARGLFARSPVTADAWMPQPLWKPVALVCSVLDHPLRRMSCGFSGLPVAAVRSSPESYDRLRSRELWNAAAAACSMAEDV